MTRKVQSVTYLCYFATMLLKACTGVMCLYRRASEDLFWYVCRSTPSGKDVLQRNEENHDVRGPTTLLWLTTASSFEQGIHKVIRSNRENALFVSLHELSRLLMVFHRFSTAVSGTVARGIGGAIRSMQFSIRALYQSSLQCLYGVFPGQLLVEQVNHGPDIGAKATSITKQSTLSRYDFHHESKAPRRFPRPLTTSHCHTH